MPAVSERARLRWRYLFPGLLAALAWIAGCGPEGEGTGKRPGSKRNARHIEQIQQEAAKAKMEAKAKAGAKAPRR